jgi:hypothetical protein
VNRGAGQAGRRKENQMTTTTKYTAKITSGYGKSHGQVTANTRRELEKKLRGMSMYGQIKREGNRGYTIYGMTCEVAGYADLA